MACRATSYWTPEPRYGAKGRALLQRAAASGQRTLSSCREPRQRSTTVSEKIRLCSSSVGLTGTPEALPLGELSPKVTERARTLTERNRRSDSIALTKRQLIAVRRLSGEGLALSVSLRSPAPPKGEPLAGRATSYWTPEPRYGAKGRALLQRAAASGQRTLSSCREPRQRSTTVSEKIRLCSSSVGLTGTPEALPLGELSPKVTERARTLTEKNRRSDSIALPKRQFIAAWRLSGDGLALSVIACAMPPLPKGEAFLCLFAQKTS